MVHLIKIRKNEEVKKDETAVASVDADLLNNITQTQRNATVTVGDEI